MRVKTEADGTDADATHAARTHDEAPDDGEPDGDEPGEAVGSERLPAVGLRSTPRFVWALTVLYGVMLGASSVLTPLFIAPDEFAHLDLSLALADDAHYPEFDGRPAATGVLVVVPLYFPDDIRNPDLEASAAPSKAERLDIETLGGTDSPPDNRLNQQPQHPPLYYQAMGAVLRAERLLVPGASPPALTTELAVLRLVNAAMMLVVPWAAWAAATRLGADRRAALAVAALAIVVPMMTHIGSVVNNDNLLVVLGSLLAVPLAGVARGDRRTRTILLIGVITGAALLTKAFAVLFIPWVAATFVVAAWRARRAGRPWFPILLAGAGSGAVALLVSGWWWIGNQLRHGDVAPSLEDVLLPTRAGFEPDADMYARMFGSFFVQRFWGSFGNYSARLPLAVIIGATAVGALLLATGLIAPGGRFRRVDTAVLLVPAVGLVAFVAQHAWELHVRTGASPFIQGRYLFPAMVPLALIAGAGARRLVRRWAPLAALAAVVGLHLVGFLTMLGEFWGGPGDGARGELRAVLAWSAWPGEAIVVGGIAGLVVGAAAVVVAAHDGWSIARADDTED